MRRVDVYIEFMCSEDFSVPCQVVQEILGLLSQQWALIQSFQSWASIRSTEIISFAHHYCCYVAARE